MLTTHKFYKFPCSEVLTDLEGGMQCLTRDIQIVWLVKKRETVQVHFTLGRPRGPKHIEWMKNLHGNYMAGSGECFMVYQMSCYAHQKEVGQMQS